MIKVSRTETHAPEAMKEPFIREQRIRDLLRERSLQQLGEFFLLNCIGRRHNASVKALYAAYHVVLHPVQT